MENFFIAPIQPGQPRMYCGPTVLAMLTGKTRTQIHADINRLKRKAGKKRNKMMYSRDGFPRGYKRMPWPLTASVKGLSNGYLEALMRKYGLAPEGHVKPYPTLRRLVEDMGHFKTPIVVNVTGHYVLYYKGKVYDTFRKEGATVDEHPHGRCRVQRYWLVKKQKMAGLPCA